ncbi:sensor domain-containing diguanylate cyclase [Halomonas sp. 328]|uniref:sensor domain-containing diguanylate cyclase n=1 Tax=Halomonas sp. 328 TaxID=2776704 RepID=UPI0018A7E0D7|nr:diguanylate cyclase [Halomonas sp. 328]MBF8221360.1 diguanylate cyclase [Halomonas sp. 328]
MLSRGWNAIRRGLGSLRGRLLLGLATTWGLVLVGVLAFGWQLGRDLVQELNATHLRYEAELIADDLSAEVSKRIAALERLAPLLEASQTHSELRAELRHNDALLAWFDGLVVSSAEGEIIADWPEVPGRVGLDLAERDFFRLPRHSRYPYISEPFQGRASRETLVMMTLPLHDADGHFQGILGGLVNLNRGSLFDRLRRIRLGEHGFAAVASASGTILFHPDPALVLQRVPGPEQAPWADLALDGWEGIAYAPLISDEMSLQAYRQIWPANWIVGVYLPQREMEAAPQALIRQLGWGGLVAVLVMLPLMWWRIGRVLAPLRQLEQQIEEVGEERRSRVVLDSRMEELRRVAVTFNRVEGERSMAHASLKERQAFLDAVLGSTPTGIFVADPAGETTYMNPALRSLVGHGAESTAPWHANLHPEERQDALDLWRHTLGSGEEFLRQCRFCQADGSVLWLEVHATAVKIDSRLLGFVGMVKDITERREIEAQQRWEAEHDPLTGLLNRRGFERRLEEAWSDWRNQSVSTVLILFDLDHFKPINDEGGHALGDELLRRLAGAVTGAVRRSDWVARLGGDEFAVLMPGCALSQALPLAEALRRAAAGVSVAKAGRRYSITLSLGVASFEPGDTGMGEALTRADAASYRAKRLGRNGVQVAAAE